MIIREELIQFEEEICSLFLDKKILCPVHLSKGNEDQLIRIFRDVKKDDWVFSTHRSHYHALLRGIPEDWIRQEILEGRSMYILNKEYKFFSSSIVGGTLPIAMGVALGIKRQGKMPKEWVWCFVGDMCAETGTFHECTKYSKRQNLPITFIVEDNGFSTNTPTQEVWGCWKSSQDNVVRYAYERGYPHVGVKQWVIF